VEGSTFASDKVQRGSPYRIHLEGTPPILIAAAPAPAKRAQVWPNFRRGRHVPGWVPPLILRRESPFEAPLTCQDGNHSDTLRDTRRGR